MTIPSQIDDPVADDGLSAEEIVAVLRHSENAGVRDALARLEFLIRLAHNEEEIEEWIADVPRYEGRLGIPTGHTYEYVYFDVCGNNCVFSYNRYGVSGKLRCHRENIFYLGRNK